MEGKIKTYPTSDGAVDGQDYNKTLLRIVVRSTVL